MKKLTSLLFCCSILLSNAQETGIEYDSFYSLNEISFNEKYSSQIINKIESDYKGEKIVHYKLEVDDESLKSPEITVLFNSEGTFRNVVYRTEVEKGQSFSFQKLFENSKMGAYEIVSKMADGKYPSILESGTVVFPIKKIRGMIMVTKSAGVLTFDVSCFPSTEEEIIELKGKSDETFTFNSYDFGKKTEPVLFQGVPLGISFWEIDDELDDFTLSTNDDALIYIKSGSVIGINALIYLEFSESVFYKGIYLFTQEYIQKNNYNEDFLKIERLLSTKYGEPSYDRDSWSNDLYEDDYQNIGLALSAGHLVKRRIWNTDAAKITLYMGGENFEVETALIYELPEMIDSEKAKKEKKELDEL
jgi:hypothetical protein